MDQSEVSNQELAPFSAVLRPNRSLSAKGFLAIMVCISLVSFAAGAMFYTMGAWPVFGFFGLDVALIYLAFRLNYRSGQVYETVELHLDALSVTRVQPSGSSQSWTFNPYWVRLGIEQLPGERSQLYLSSHGKRLVFGSFLTDPEKHHFANTLKAALLENRGETRI